MSDAPQKGQITPEPRFLQRIVDGAFDRVRPLEPRRPSLFERPTVDVADTVERAADSIANEEDGIRRSDPTDVSRRTSRDRASQDQAALISSQSRADDDRSGESAQRAKGDRAREAADRALQPAEPTPRLASERLPDVRDARPLLSLQPVNIDLVVPRDRPPHTAPPAHGTGDLPIVPAAEVGILSGPRVNVDGLHADSRPLLPDRRDRNAPEPTGPVRRDERHPMHAAAAVVTRPVVNVTIGRIEVRVASAQPSRRPQRSEPPKPMSLDQYLQRRGEPR